MQRRDAGRRHPREHPEDPLSEPLGNLLDSLGVVHTPDEGEMVTDAVVLMKVVDEHGGVILRTAWSEGMSWIERLGMLHAAEASETPSGDWSDED